MEAIEFVNRYQDYISEIEKVVKPEYKEILDKMKETDPHDLVSPESWFQSSLEARGLVWGLFLRECKDTLSKNTQTIS